jgi:hypothetical protein
MLSVFFSLFQTKLFDEKTKKDAPEKPFGHFYPRKGRIFVLKI